MDVYEMQSAVVIADEKRQELIFNFKPMKDDPEISLALPAASIGHMIAQMAGAHQSLAMKRSDDAGVLLPLKLTGVRPMDSAEGNVLLLQFEGVFELAVLVDPKNMHALANAALLAAGKSGFSPPTTN